MIGKLPVQAVAERVAAFGLAVRVEHYDGGGWLEVRDGEDVERVFFSDGVDVDAVVAGAFSSLQRLIVLALVGAPPRPGTTPGRIMVVGAIPVPGLPGWWRCVSRRGVEIGQFEASSATMASFVATAHHAKQIEAAAGAGGAAEVLDETGAAAPCTLIARRGGSWEIGVAGERRVVELGDLRTNRR